MNALSNVPVMIVTDDGVARPFAGGMTAKDFMLREVTNEVATLREYLAEDDEEMTARVSEQIELLDRVVYAAKNFGATQDEIDAAMVD